MLWASDVSSRRAIAGLALAASIVPVLVLVAGAVAGPGFGNDFSSYWLAGRLVASGHDPYDLAALASLATHEHVTFLLGSGYSYLPPFAVLMVPLAQLPFRVALLCFDAVSVVVFAVAIAAWVRRLTAAREGPLGVVIALAAGAYPPAAGSVYFGQVNLLVFGVLAAALWPMLAEATHWPASSTKGATASAAAGRQAGGRELLVGTGVAVAGVVKLVPLVLVVPLVLWRRWRAVAVTVLSAAGLLAATALVVPAAASGTSELSTLFVADGFWSNQSLNGFATRLVSATDRTVPLLPGLAGGAALGLVLVAVLAGATLVVLVLGRHAAAPSRGLALGAGLALTAAVAGAPKDSFWNHLPVLLAASLLLAATSRSGNGGPFGGLLPAARGLVGAWYLAAWVELAIDATQGLATRALGTAGAVLSSTALLGVLALWAAIAMTILRRNVVPRTHVADAAAPYSAT